MLRMFRLLCGGLLLLLLLTDVGHAGTTLMGGGVRGNTLDQVLHLVSFLLAVLLIPALLGLLSSKYGWEWSGSWLALMFLATPALYSGCLWLSEGTDRGAARWHLIPVIASMADAWAFVAAATWPLACILPVVLTAVAWFKSRRGALIHISVLSLALVSLTWGSRVRDFILD